MSTKNALFGMTKKTVTVPAYSVLTVDYLDTKPNYFRVQNQGSGKLYCSGDHIPTITNYDFVVSGGGLKMFTEPTNRNALYIYNPSGTPAVAVVVSFQADFDPVALVLSEIEIEVPSTIEAAQAINSINCSLPSGSNKIGSVGIDGTVSLANAADITTIKTNTTNTNTKLDTLNAHQTTIESKLDAIAAGSGEKKPITHFGSGSENKTLTPADGYMISEMAFFSNDGDADITVTVIDMSSNSSSVVVKAGEVLNNIQMWAKSFSVVSAGVPYRYGWVIKEG